MPYTLTVPLPTKSQLEAGARVEISGVLVGRVTDIVDSPEGPEAELQIIPVATPIPAGTEALVGLKPMPRRYYLDLRQGESRKSLPSGAVLPPARSQVQLDRLLSG